MTSVSNDEARFREVLGPVFDELSQKDFMDIPINELVSSDDFDKIKLTTYMMQMAIQGSVAIDLATSIDHWTETDCEECSNFLHLFTMQFTINLWQTILADLEDYNE